MDEERCREMIQLVRRIRHDASSPITAALGHTQLLLEEPVASDPDVNETLKLVESELQRLIDILSRLGEIRYDDGAPPQA